MQTPKKLRQSKYLIKAIIKCQYPRKSVYDFMNSGLELIQDSNNKIPKNCYISWKTNLLARSHYADLRNFVISNPEFKFYFFTDYEQDEWMRINLASYKNLNLTFLVWALLLKEMSCFKGLGWIVIPLILLET